MDDDENVLVRKPSKAAQNEKLPVVTAHSDVLDGLVDDLGFHYTTVSHHTQGPDV